MNPRKTPHQKIKELEKKVKLLEQEKEILNWVIDFADQKMGANIRKKHLPLLLKTSKQQGDSDAP